MPVAFVDNPVLNSPYRAPTRHFHLNEDGTPTGVIDEGRRRSEHLVPIPAPRRRGPQQVELDLEGVEEQLSPNNFINELRGHVERWRALPPSQWGVSYETETLLKHRHSAGRELPLFFCQIEAVETLIWLTEVARPSRQHAHLERDPGQRMPRPTPSSSAWP